MTIATIKIYSSNMKNFVGSSNNVNGHSSVDDPSNLLLSNKTKLQHLSDEERDHLNRSKIGSEGLNDGMDSTKNIQTIKGQNVIKVLKDFKTSDRIHMTLILVYIPIQPSFNITLLDGVLSQYFEM